MFVYVFQFIKSFKRQIIKNMAIRNCFNIIKVEFYSRDLIHIRVNDEKDKTLKLDDVKVLFVLLFFSLLSSV